MKNYTTLLILILSLFKQTFAQNPSPFIVIDQFGYLPEATKIAVIRDPQTGYDAAESFSPGNSYSVVNNQGAEVFTGTAQVWSSGSEDASSGDKAWWFDFSAVQTPGIYYVVDNEKNVRSHKFVIGEAVYNDVLKHAVRTFYYQRAGFAKEAPYAGSGWVDGASHMQDKQARSYDDINNPATARDVQGGWYDAGDYNKYTNWTASYIVQMMLAYLERPEAWADNYNIPESGNGIPDLLDEAKWGLDHLLRLQNTDGSVIAIVDLDHASPPSSATGPSYYGAVNTSSAQSAAAAFAIASKVYRSLGQDDFADTLVKRAEMAWNWSEVNPNIIWRNNDATYGSSGIGAGQQEQSDYDRAMGRLKAACFLFDATGNSKYRNYFDANYQDAHLFAWSFAYPFEGEIQDMLLYYTQITDATVSVKTNIINTYKGAMNGSENFAAFTGNKDPYRAHLKDYTWGSNNIKSIQGTMFYNMISYNVDNARNMDASKAAAGYINYIHGVNPLGLVYLSNMYSIGGDNCVNEFYHSWFYDGNSKWDRVGVSEFGPPPGFLTGGPNPGYNWDACCPSSCGSSANNAICNSQSISPPKGQPKQKAYKDFNTSWPLNSWEVTENSCGYQISYIRLLSKFVNLNYDCNNDLNGEAYINDCGICVGGNTGLSDTRPCPISSTFKGLNTQQVVVFPNPSTGIVNIENLPSGQYSCTITELSGRTVMTKVLEPGNYMLNIAELGDGYYFLKLWDGKDLFIVPFTRQ